MVMVIMTEEDKRAIIEILKTFKALERKLHEILDRNK